jgi:hypothetical protein
MVSVNLFTRMKYFMQFPEASLHIHLVLLLFLLYSFGNEDFFPTWNLYIVLKNYITHLLPLFPLHL